MSYFTFLWPESLFPESGRGAKSLSQKINKKMMRTPQYKTQHAATIKKTVPIGLMLKDKHNILTKQFQKSIKKLCSIVAVLV